jgi:hypothetical protein
LLGIGAAIVAVGLVVRLQSADAGPAVAGDACSQARAAYRTLGSGMTTALAKQGAEGQAAMLQATLKFRVAVQGSSCGEVPRLRRQVRRDIAAVCRPCARALERSRA